MNKSMKDLKRRGPAEFVDFSIICFSFFQNLALLIKY